jgi:hypothetical protein
MVWDTEQYWRKAKRYIELASAPEREEWERPFWFSLAVEFLARACLTKIHPALNADPQEEGVHLLFAFGYELTGQPKSLPAHAVYARLEKMFPDRFRKPDKDFCGFFSNLRNQELHTGELPFESLSEKKWLPHFYEVCAVLCELLGKQIDDLLGDETETAKALIATLKKEKTSSVQSKIADHRRVFRSKAPEEQKKLVAEQAILSNAWGGTTKKMQCPACGAWARLEGRVERVSKPIYEDPELLVKNVVVANRLECKACELVLNDIEELLIADIEPHFEFYETVDLHDYHEPDFGPEYNNM